MMRTVVALCVGLLLGSVVGRWDERHPFHWWLRLLHWEHLWCHRVPAFARIPAVRRRAGACRFCAYDRERAADAAARATDPRDPSPRGREA